MLNFREFVEVAINNGVCNDINDLWVDVDGEQYAVHTYDILGREEEEPFEASEVLESDKEHKMWETLYSLYVASC